MDKNTLNKLLKEKKLTDILMKDKDFISEAKAILKEESPDITDENLENILKSVEKALSGEVKIENDDDLENVVGGLGTTGKKIARGAIKSVCTLAGYFTGYAGVGECLYKINDKLFGSDRHSPTASWSDEKTRRKYFVVNSAEEILGISSTIGFLYGGYKLGEWICKKLDLEE